MTKSEFAALAGVSVAAISKACKSLLLAAYDGKKFIDTKHKVAQAYLESKQLEQAAPPATGIDPLYEDAIQACAEKGRYNVNTIRTALSIGSPRARAILQTMEAAGITAETPAPPTQPAPPTPQLKGGAVQRESKKSGRHDDEPEGIPDNIQLFADMTIREVISKFGTDYRFVDYLKALKEIEMVDERRVKNAKARGELVSRQLIRDGIIEPIDSAHIKLLTDGSRTIAKRVTAMHDAKRDLKDIEDFIKDQIASFIRPAKAKAQRTFKNVSS